MKTLKEYTKTAIADKGNGSTWCPGVHGWDGSYAVIEKYHVPEGVEMPPNGKIYDPPSRQPHKSGDGLYYQATPFGEVVCDYNTRTFSVVRRSYENLPVDQ